MSTLSRRSLSGRALLGIAATAAALLGLLMSAAWGVHANNVLESDVLGRGGREWKLIAGKHWQLASDRVEAPEVTDAAEGTTGGCGPGMVEVQGAMRTEGEAAAIEDLQDTTCVEWISRDFPDRCKRFDEQKWLALEQRVPSRPTHFCIDRFEYPNRKGDYPIVAVTWNEAIALCEVRGERLCTEEEWTFACEGPEARPYANGYVRDSAACVIDRPWRLVDERALLRRDSWVARVEVDFLWQGEASGSHPRCRSPFGVYDMNGNVDEWTRSVRSSGVPSILKGGYWGPVRTRCRPSTRAHDPDFYFYQQGFRCCTDATAGADGGEQ